MKETWNALFIDIQSDIDRVMSELNESPVDICPSNDEVFKCFSYFDVLATKVVIVGQDPYHTTGTATGLSFQSNDDKMPPSLTNIFKAIKNFYPNATCDIELWAKQGVLMFNRALTVETNKPNSHTKAWKSITNQMIKLLSEYMRIHGKSLVFMLWGNNAKELIPFIDENIHTVLTHTHPSPLSRKPFTTCDHFRKCNEIHEIEW